MSKSLLARRAAVSAVAAAIVACGSPSMNQSITATGTVHGHAVPTTAGFAALGPVPPGASMPAGQILAVSLTSSTKTSCASTTANGNVTVLGITLGLPPGAVAPGTHAIGFPNATLAAFGAIDAQCAVALSESASSGSITLTDVTGSQVSGSFDLSFGADHVTGTFSVPLCASDVANGTGTDGGVACTP